VGLASCARLARGALVSTASINSTTTAYRTMTVIILVVVTTGRRGRLTWTSNEEAA
jgi:hypothetical protein